MLTDEIQPNLPNEGPPFPRGVTSWLPFRGLWPWKFEQDNIFMEAKQTALRLGKPLLNAGCGSAYWRGLNESDVNIDIEPRDVPNFVLCSVEDMSMFPDKYFGAVFCSHVLEHVNNLQAAKSELERVADYQYIITPNPLSLSGWLSPWHVRVFKDNHGGDVLVELPPKPWIKRSVQDGI